MGRPKRADEAGGIYHLLNCANRRATIFHKHEDDQAFERIMAKALERVSLKLFSYCPMTPNKLSDAVENFEELKAAVAGTEFESLI